jgi:hypothetical protein
MGITRRIEARIKALRGFDPGFLYKGWQNPDFSISGW